MNGLGLLSAKRVSFARHVGVLRTRANVFLPPSRRSSRACGGCGPGGPGRNTEGEGRVRGGRDTVRGVGPHPATAGVRGDRRHPDHGRVQVPEGSPHPVRVGASRRVGIARWSDRSRGRAHAPDRSGPSLPQPGRVPFDCERGPHSPRGRSRLRPGVQSHPGHLRGRPRLPRLRGGGRTPRLRILRGLGREQRDHAGQEPVAESWTRCEQWLRDRESGPPRPHRVRRQAVGPRAGIRPRGRFPGGRRPRGVLREASGKPVLRRLHRRGDAARCDHDEGLDCVVPVTFYTASLVTRYDLRNIMAEELETAQIPPHIMAAMRDRMKMAQRMSRIKHKIVVMSGKGGVGKSSVATNLACVLAESGPTGLVDADVTGPDIAKLMGVEDAQVKATDTGLEPTTGPAGVRVISMAQMIDRDTAVVWRGPLKIKALKQMLSDVEWGDLDYLVIDLPPGTSDEPLSVAQEIPDADGAVVVTTPQEVSLLDVRKSIAFARAVKMDILGVIENMSGFVCPHCGKQTDIFKVGGGEAAAEELGLPFLGRIPLDPRIVIGGAAGKPFVLEHPDSAQAQALRP